MGADVEIMRDWNVSAGFGPQLEFYLPARVRLVGPALGHSVQTVQFRPRNSMEFYATWNRPVSDAFHWIDEPTNRFFLEARYRKTLAFGLDVFHPKMVADTLGPLANVQITRGFMQLQPFLDWICVRGPFELRLGAGVGPMIGYAYVEHGGVASAGALSLIGASLSVRSAAGVRFAREHAALMLHADGTLGALSYGVLSGHALQTHAAVKLGVSLSVGF